MPTQDNTPAIEPPPLSPEKPANQNDCASATLAQHAAARCVETECLAFDLLAGPRPGALAWENRLTHRVLHLGGGEEISAHVDRSSGRIGIMGWKGILSSENAASPNEEEGYVRGFAKADFDDSHWPGLMTTVTEGYWKLAETFWARTQVDLPLAYADEDLTLVLGGCGLFDFNVIRLFVNGWEVSTRRETARWREPGEFRFPVGSEARGCWKFGGRNVIAVQQSGYQARSSALNAVDPTRTRNLPLKCQWPVPWEQYIVFGQPLESETFHTTRISHSGAGRCTVSARSASFEAAIQYEAEGAVLRKSVRLRNTTDRPQRLMHFGLGDYQTQAEVTEGEQGFPVYADDSFFIGLAHPSGFAMGENGRIRLRQHPGIEIQPGEDWLSMEAVLGVTPEGKARKGFLDHLQTRMRRMRRGHDHPYAFAEPFGGRMNGNQEELERYWLFGYFDETEDYLLDHLDKVEAVQKQTGCQFDAYFLQFWHDYNGTLKEPNPKSFPRGLTPVFDRIRALGMEPGLWIDSSWELWSCGGNPAVAGCHTHDPAYGTDRDTLCRAADPYRTIFTEAFVHHVRDQGIKFLKFDNLQACCFNPAHGHLPGRHATEAIQNAVISTLGKLDEICPEVFIMLYWGHRSPWWLLHADTLFEPGLQIEAAHPGGSPTLFARDSVVAGLDQAHWFCRDLPALGKDSLGVWMSEWKWNSMLGTERNAEGFVMDLCRGNLLIQPWSDPGFLDFKGRETLGRIIALLRARPECFANSRFILGNPWKYEPYGYCCTDGKRAFLAINNCTWEFRNISLDLVSWEMDPQAAWAAVRWHPDPAALPAVNSRATIPLKPFEIVLLEIYPLNEQPSLGENLPAGWLAQAKQTRQTAMETTLLEETRAKPGEFPRPPGALPPVAADIHYVKRLYRIAGETGPGLFCLTAELRKDGLPCALENLGDHFQLSGADDAVAILGRKAFSTPWQGWRIPRPSAGRFLYHLEAMLPHGVSLALQGRLLPLDDESGFDPPININ